MIPLSGTLAAWLPYLSLLLLLLAVAIVVGVVLLLRRAARSSSVEPKAGPKPAGQPELEPQAAQLAAPGTSAIAAQSAVLPSRPMLGDATAVLNETLTRLRQAMPGADYRYGTPWFLMMGLRASGKSALVQSLPLRQPMEPVLGQGGLSTWFFEQGVVLDADGALLEDHPGNSAGKAQDAGGWMRLLRLLQRARPRRPLDGVILTLSVEDLLGEGHEGEEARLQRAETLNRRLWDLQRSLGLALPIYVILTQADRVVGFEAFWQEMPHSRLQEIFGWSNPYSPQTSFQADWVSEAFSNMDVDLLRATLEVSADRANPADGDGLILFQSNFARLEGPARQMLERIFRANVYHEPLMVRGIYTSGHLDPALAISESRVGEALATARPREETRARPILLGELFEQRIFCESGLVRADRRSFFSRNRRVLTAQVAFGSIAAVLSLGLVVESLRINADIRTLEPVLRQISTDMADIREKELQFARLEQADASRVSFLTTDNTRRLLDAMTQISTNSLRSPFLPSSWFSGLDYRISEFITVGLENVVLRAMHNQFDQRTQQTLEAARLQTTAVSGFNENGALERMEEFRKLQRFVAELREIEDYARRYNQLGQTRNLEDVAELVDYLFGIPLPQQFFAYPEFVQSALGRVHIRPFAPEDYRAQATSRARNLTWQLYGWLFNSGPSLSGLISLARELRQLEEGGLGLERDAAAFQRVIGLIDSAERVVTLPENRWIYAVSFDPAEPLDRVLGEIGQSRVLGPELAAELTRLGDSEAQLFIDKLLAIRSRAIGSMLEADANGYLRPAPQVTALRTRLTALFGEEFMTVRPRGELGLRGEEAGRLVWDRDRLQRALRLYGDYETFLAGDLRELPEVFRDRVQRLAAARLDGALRNAIAEAMSFDARDNLGRLTGREEGLAQRVSAFARVSGDMDRLLAIFRQLELDASYYDLQDLLALQVGEMLDRADRLLEADGLYRPVLSLAEWNGREDPVLYAFNLRNQGELDFYLDGQRARVEELLRQLTQPLLSFALSDDLAQSHLPSATLSRWQQILQAVSAHSARRPGNPLDRLERSLRADLRDIRAESCQDQLAELPSVIGSGFFEERQRSFMDDLAYRCETLRDSDIQQTLARIAGSFEDSLAGRYPFASVETSAEASPSEIRSFFARVSADLAYLAEREERHEALSEEERRFLRSLAEARRFFAPLLAEDAETGTMGLAYALSFRVNRAQEQGANAIIDWRFADGERVVTARSSERQGRWRYGDRATVTLRWAKDGPNRPVAAAGGRVNTEEASVTFAGEGGWSLLRLLQRHAASAGDFVERRDPDPQTLRFDIETASREADELAGLAAETARVFLRVNLLAETSDGAQQGPLRLPDFPRRAPSRARVAQN